jgi:formylglycine-generating enzyme required for sulfatase activity
MRLIPAGWFTMGSPDGEAGRWDHEGPQQAIHIRQPFWLFDTPCTQQLWEAAMGENPSMFSGPLRPVEQFDFRAVARFMERLNRKIAGLNLVLPSEAQWEYACRAGTITPRYAEPLDAIAWYSGNSDRTTHPVKERDPNAWGLYDMLGNVWECCADAWSRTLDGTPADGSARPGGGAADRVLRGGSWADEARHMRAASRNVNGPSLRVADLGFRCARVQEPV